jgi:hypothetical protein
MYKGPDSYNTPPNQNIWGDEKKRERSNFADAAYPKSSSDEKIISHNADEEAHRLATIEARTHAANVEQEQLANLLSSDLVLSSDTDIAPTNPKSEIQDSFGPDTQQLKTIDEIYDEHMREENLTRVVNPGIKTPHSIDATMPNVNIRDVVTPQAEIVPEPAPNTLTQTELTQPLKK